MDSTVWRRASDVFSQLLDVPETSRSRTLDELELDAEVRQCIERLLEAHARTGLLDGPPAMRPAAAAPERRLGCWLLGEQIGRGGSGVVFHAMSDANGIARVAAVKVMSFLSLATRGAEHFRREQAILARLNHPHIVPLIDGGVEADGTPWFAMPLVRGQPIDAWFESGISVRRMLGCFIEVCGAVSYAHQSLVVHRDLKPSNVWVDESGHVRLLDFGIARLLDEGGAEATATHNRMLTPEYAAPEQFRGAPPSTAMDVHGLGALLYRLLARRAVRARDGDPNAMPVAPSKALLRAGDATRARIVRGDLDAIVLKAIDSEPSRRYATAKELSDDLRRWFHGVPVRARAPSLAYTMRRFVARHRLATFATVLALAGIVTGFVSARVEAERARREATRAVAVQDLLLDLFGAADPESRDKPVTDVRQLLDQWPARLSQSLETEPAARAELLLVAGGARARLGDNDEARALIEQALRIAVTSGGSDLLSGRASKELAEIDASVERWPDARTRLDTAIDALASAPEPRARALLFHAYLDRAYALRELASLDASNADVARAVALLPSLGAKDPWPAARVHYVRGMNEIAANANEAAWQDFDAARKLVGDDSPRAIAILTELGQSSLWLGRGDEAVDWYRRALALSRKYLAPDSQRLSMAYHNLGFVLEQLSRSAEAEAPLREALRIQQQNGSPLPSTQSMLARSLRRIGRTEEAMQLYDAAFDSTLATLGPQHPRTIDALVRSANGHVSAGDVDGAWDRSLRAVDLAQAAADAGTGTKPLGAALRSASAIALKSGRARDALAFVERARPIPTDEDDLVSVGWEIRIHLELGDVKRAIALARANRDAALAVPDAFASNRAMTLSALARAEHAAGNDAEARRLLEIARKRPDGVERYGEYLESEMSALAAQIDPARKP
ncbi:MAG TPA: serine/threonine-protein kinase [Xanthomonadales bacterium]|nr:serine/threonine-protein kinase [Xanthomonadales bacterium]